MLHFAQIQMEPAVNVNIRIHARKFGLVRNAWDKSTRALNTFNLLMNRSSSYQNIWILAVIIYVPLAN